MNKNEMVKLLNQKFSIWRQVSDFMIGVECINGWYPYWEGERPIDFILCSKNPRGDDTGENITYRDFHTY